MNKKILVTGAAGFIGSHLTELLVNEGFDVKSFVHYNSKNNWGWLETSEVKNEVEVVAGDVRDYDSVYDAMKGIDFVFHLAALIGIPYSYYSPLAYIKTNIEGTYNILQAARKLDIQRVIHTSTSEVYGTAQYIPLNENHPINPQSPYAATKASGDYLAKSFYLSFDFPVTIVRPFNTFGPRQSARAVIPTIITQVLNDKKVIKLGNLNSSRDFTYVLDTIEGIYQIGLHDKTMGEVINIGSGKDISIYEILNIVNKLINDNINIKTKIESKRVRPEKSEIQRLVCDYSKAQNLSGWKPKYTFEEGLKETIDWFKENLKIYKEGIYNV